MKNCLHLFLSDVVSESRLTKEAEFVLSNGYCSSVTVLGLWRSGLAREEVSPGGMQIRRVELFVRSAMAQKLPRALFPVRKLLAAFSYIQYMVSASVLARKLKARFVACHNVELLPFAAMAAKTVGAKLVYVPHELESQKANSKPMGRKALRFMEGSFIKQCKDVVVVCEPIAKWYREAYKLDNVHVVRNLPTRAAAVKAPKPGRSFRELFQVPAGAVIFIYQGLFGPERGTPQLIEAFERLDPGLYHLVFMGYGSAEIEGKIKQAAAKHGNIHFLPAVPMPEIVSYTSTADVGIFVTDNMSPSYRNSLPNKFFEYVHAGLPVIVSDNLDYLSGLIEEHRIGMVTGLGSLTRTIQDFTPEQVQQYKSALATFARDAVWEEDAKAFGKVYG